MKDVFPNPPVWCSHLKRTIVVIFVAQHIRLNVTRHNRYLFCFQIILCSFLCLLASWMNSNICCFCRAPFACRVSHIICTWNNNWVSLFDHNSLWVKNNFYLIFVLLILHMTHRLCLFICHARFVFDKPIMNAYIIHREPDGLCMALGTKPHHRSYIIHFGDSVVKNRDSIAILSNSWRAMISIILLDI